ncbi:MAG: hypothetical protein A3B99_04965 [Candidatus Yanofskybacteria bacterium RIFCSPHIGHO2_02_FULL_44_12b]|uniref:Uncharacterized protein n=2 Tax=Candidatus Yanofskyibacteriota TaxID=1752733 RepID=A0A1F8GK64_9BACT|nr:MAG: hypothetical protein UW79_C0024G0013 [Candidatus Yanofskybacteria bacterium GW2011_GWA2_44_9]OGN04406.1 MAG: hypothetical protein A2659_03700 [Candidatus Yanofskybacteria bacterium RIFCSPHIGHO2_01_FULL_44_24]OGN16201.1 MAG: hypothetical protein A3B99_04965 [Candidatus Yanofskybacteria bacterium RIFCSPHIGHO2_02_FULL_44_12b]OGN25794.1 MAG: hypothetical protein A2925_01230 [Candidatus Yanofskybacteria bacterium RIFCSPLOWO2_01_FULL_44_22]
MEKNILESLIEEILKAAIGVEVSVCSLGNEWSVNINGELFSFVVDGELVVRIPTLPICAK